MKVQLKEGRKEGKEEGWKEGRMDGWKEGKKDRRIEGRKEEWMDGWMDGWMGNEECSNEFEYKKLNPTSTYSTCTGSAAASYQGWNRLLWLKLLLS